MTKYLFVFTLISVIVIFSIIIYFYWHTDLELIFILDPDNYDILEFISLNNNAIYIIFLLVNLFVVNLAFFKDYFNKLPLGFKIFQPTNFINKFCIRSPPLFVN